jgi:hypothetical protein
VIALYSASAGDGASLSWQSSDLTNVTPALYVWSPASSASAARADAPAVAVTIGKGDWLVCIRVLNPSGCSLEAIGACLERLVAGDIEARTGCRVRDISSAATFLDALHTDNLSSKAFAVAPMPSHPLWSSAALAPSRAAADPSLLPVHSEVMIERMSHDRLTLYVNGLQQFYTQSPLLAQTLRDRLFALLPQHYAFAKTEVESGSSSSNK